MSETQPQPPRLHDGGIIAISAGAYGVGGIFIGMGVGELGVIPLGFPEEHEEWADRNDQKRDIQDQLNDNEALLHQVEDTPQDLVDLTALKGQIANQEAQIEVLENTHIAYDDIYLPVVGITVGAGLLIGGAIGAVRCKLQLRKQDRLRAETEAP